MGKSGDIRLLDLSVGTEVVIATDVQVLEDCCYCGLLAVEQ